MSATVTTPVWVIPIADVPNQTLACNLGGQSCQIALYQKTFTAPDESGNPAQVTALFLDLSIENAPIVQGVLCLQAVRCVRDAYLGFAGDLVFYDTQPGGQPPADPTSPGLGSRFVLTWQPGLA